MRTWLTAPLLAATILGSMLPSIAQAQEGQRQGRWNRGGDAGASAPMRGSGMRSGGEMGGGNWGRQNGGEMRTQRPAMPAGDGQAVNRAPRGDWGQRRADGDNGWRGRQPGQNVTPSASPPAAAPAPRIETNGRDRARWQQRRTEGWQGNRPDVGRPGDNRPGGDAVRGQAPNGDALADAARRDWIERNRDRNDRNDRRDDRRDNRNWDRDRNGANVRNGWNGNNNWGRPGYQQRLSDRDRWNGGQRWSRDWRRDNRYDWQRYRQLNRSYYRMPAYYAPYGWNGGYRRFSIGIFLSNSLFAQNYWIDDPSYYRLPPAYGTLRWIRYYDDALLVDMRDGYVVDVVNDFFW
jgi:hypothetical protein